MKQLHGKSLLDRYIKPITRLHVDQTIADEENTHQIRVCIKRIRAMLALHEALTGIHPQTSQLDEHLQQLKAALSARRDHDVQLELLDWLLQGTDDTSLIALLSRTRDTLSASSLPQLVDVNRIENLTSDILDQYHQFPLIDIRVKRIRGYLDKRLRKICKKGGLLLREADCLSLHSWRKLVKRLYYQAEALRSVARKSPLKNKILGRLGERLGDIHDLCVLESMLHTQQTSHPGLADPEVYQLAFQRLDTERARVLKHCRKLHKKLCIK